MEYLKLIPIFLIILLTSCNSEEGGGFEPNNLISIAEDIEAETELAKSSAAPFITSFTLSSDKTYAAGEVITITTLMSKRTLVDGTPRIPLNIGGDIKYADYVSGSGSTEFNLVWSYTIVAGDLDHDGISLVSPFELNSGNVYDYANKTALRTFTSPATTGLIVDTANLTAGFNAGSIYDNSGSINITLAASNITEMNIGSSCAGGTWEAYATTKSYNLPLSNSINSVYVTVRNAAGGRVACINASITHDNQAPNIIATITPSNTASDIATDLSSWSATTDIGPSGLSHYEYAVSTNTTAAGIIAGGSWVSNLTVTSYQITSGVSLTGGGTYYTLVRAVDLAGNTSALKASPSWGVILSPEQITSMSVVNRSTDFIKVGWPYPDDNGTPITDYIIQYKLSSDSAWITINDGVSTSRRHQLNGLGAELNYDFRVRSFNNVNYGAWSPVLSTETLPNVDFFQPGFKAINIGGATNNQLVSFEDGNQIYKDGNSTPIATLNKGDVLAITATDFTIIEADKAFFIAGRLGSGSNANKANIVWVTNSWVGKDFLFNHNRSTPMKLKVYAFTASTVVVSKAGVTIDTQTISAETGHTFTLPAYGSYKLTSTGFVGAYTYANAGGTQYTDPKPLLPSSTDLIGVPSSRGKLTSGTNANGFTAYFSNNTTQTGTLTAGVTQDVNGTGSRYAGAGVRVRATSNVVANSYADADGNCSAPFAPTAFQKKRFGLNVAPKWSSFVSTNPAVITVTQPGGATSTITLARTGANNNTPYKAHRTTAYPEGTIFESNQAFQMWYEPINDTNAANDDETIMFGWD
jgi:hypothetical protein